MPPRKPHPRSGRFRGGPQRGGALSSVHTAHTVRVPRAYWRRLGCQASYEQGPDPAARTRKLTGSGVASVEPCDSGVLTPC
ncbi:hypothetical protein NDU88_002639 [Pleurodeles waltl]|uniref:Uncharacterized protein n=1 Tax=Pleurodeles waltl TaxID=8319 RepID=A0AAV7T2K8_PLEWA|nr:hypothetical protein NDU88_002639 [Pleurodeles waltl]